MSTMCFQAATSFSFENAGIKPLNAPSMPSPFGIADDPSFLDVSSFERSSEVQSVIDSMKKFGIQWKVVNSIENQ